jgi:hypothetical protein
MPSGITPIKDASQLRPGGGSCADVHKRAQEARLAARPTYAAGRSTRGAQGRSFLPVDDT